MPNAASFSHTFLSLQPVNHSTLRRPPAVPHRPRVALSVSGDRIAVREADACLRLAVTVLGEGEGVVHLGAVDGSEMWLRIVQAEAEAEVLAGVEGAAWMPLREAGPLLDPREASLALTAVGMTRWREDYRFCATCGGELTSAHDGWMQRCERGHMHFPRTDPAVIMAITDAEDRLLFAHNRRFRTAMHSVLAGFVEPGESLEAAVGRESLEEAGLPVEDVRYVASQPWPYPRSLMVGFTARLAAGHSGDITLEDDELVSARWVSREQFAAEREAGTLAIPDSASIARHLIDAWAEAKG